MQIDFFYNIKTTIPPIISNEPITAFNVTGSFRNINASIMVRATLSLSIGAITERGPSAMALK